MASAFRQLAVAPDALPYSTIAIWASFSLKWPVWVMAAMPFGLMSAVLDFNRVTNLLVVAARRWLARPVIGYNDDFLVLELVKSRSDSAAIFRDFVLWLCFLLDKDKKQGPAPSVDFLGAEVASTSDEALLAPKDGKLPPTLETLRALQSHTTVAKQPLLSLRGKV